MKIQYNLRLDPQLKTALEIYSTDTKVPVTNIIELAVTEFLKKNKEQINSKEFKKYLEYVTMQNARALTKIEMSRVMFLHNARKRFVKMFKDGIPKEQLESLIMVWINEAEANGVKATEFLIELKKYIGGCYKWTYLER